MRFSRKVLISVFIVLNLAAVLYANRPGPLVRAFRRHVMRPLPRQAAYQVNLAGWWLLQYAHLTGLDNRWEMFGRQSRFNWSYLIQAKDAEGRTAVLPLPRQSRRTFWEEYFFDFREAKFHLNLYPRRQARLAYARYLCRRFSEVEGRPVRSILYELRYQYLIPMRRAAERGTHVDPKIHQQMVDEFACAAEGSGT